VKRRGAYRLVATAAIDGSTVVARSRLLAIR
jgi:hypothetical protein